MVSYFKYMLLINTKLGTSRKHGIGLFANQFIPKGTKTWEYITWFDHSYTAEELDQMSEFARRQVLWYAYFDTTIQKFVLPADDQRFINHSSDPKDINIDSTPDFDIAICDINIGDELICDYDKFDSGYFDRHGYDRAKLS